MNRTSRTVLCLTLCITVTVSACAGTGPTKSASGAAMPGLEVGNRVVIGTHDGREFELVVAGVDGDCVRTAADPCAVRVGEIARVEKIPKHDAAQVAKVTIGILLMVGLLVATAMLYSQPSSGEFSLFGSN